MKNGELSFWLVGPNSPTPPETKRLESDESFDVAIVGGGVTGLWSAWALKQRDPSLDVAVFEAERLGFGASGRNGGLLSTKPVGSKRVLARGARGEDGVREAERLLRDAMDDVVKILGADNIHANHGGWMQVARTPSEEVRLRVALSETHDWAQGADPNVSWLDADQVAERIRIHGARGALYSPDNYALDPARMVFQLADTVVRSGVRIYTDSRAEDIAPGGFRVNSHRVTARYIVIATEAYTASERGQRRLILPMNSAQLVTEPLTEEEWAAIGWDGYESLAGAAHTYFYSKRTRDGRIAIGGRGRPYRYASGYDHDGRVDDKTVNELTQVLHGLFPDLELTPAHAWCGVLGVPRDWSPFVDLNAETRVVRIGGYVGQGIAAAHVAGHTAADLILGRESTYTRSAWVRPHPRKWEPEPLRWLGANGIYRLYAWADKRESRSSSAKTSRLARLADKVSQR